MWRAIRRFCFRRDRGAGQVPHGIVEKDGPGDQPNNSDDAVQSAGQDLEEPSGPPVRGTVKWFSPIKGYGFVVLSDGSGDVFLHASALAGVGITNLQPGEALELRVTLGQRGPQVTEVISVDHSTAAPLRPPRKRFGPKSDRQALEATVHEAGTVK
jgi:CspA family cold shock protein